MKKIAFLFLIYDRIEQEALWHAFFENIDPRRFSIHIHFKTHRPLEFFEQYRFKESIPTEYMDISIVHAHNLLIEEAMQDPTVYKTVNLSQSCIPLKTFKTVYEFLTKDDSSHFNDCGRKNLFPRCDPALPYLDHDETRISKSSNWFVLNRTHADLCLVCKQYVEYFKDVTCPEEHVHITTIRNEDPNGPVYYTDNLSDGATTFTNWPDMDYLYRSDKGLKTYSSISIEEIEYLWKAPSLFGRKFIAECTVGSANTPLVEYLAPKLVSRRHSFLSRFTFLSNWWRRKSIEN